MERDRRVEERLAALRYDIAQADPGLWLTDEQIDALYKVFAYALRILHSVQGEDDSTAINAICDLIEPYLTLIIHGGAVCTCPRPRYHTGRKYKPAA